MPSEVEQGRVVLGVGRFKIWDASKQTSVKVPHKTLANDWATPEE